MSSQPLRALLSRLRPGSLRHQAMPTPQQAPLSMSIRSDAVSGAMSGPSVKSLATAVSQTHHLIREAASAFAGLAQLPQGYAQRARAAIGGVSGRQGMIRLAEAFVAAAMKAAESGDAIIAVDTALSDAAARGGADKLRLLHARMSGAPGGRGGGGRTRGGGRAQGGSGKRVAPTRAGGGGVGADAGGDEVEGGSRRDFGGGGHGQGHGAGQKRSGDPHGEMFSETATRCQSVNYIGYLGAFQWGASCCLDLSAISFVFWSLVCGTSVSHGCESITSRAGSLFAGDARAREVLEGLRNASRHLTRSVTPFLIFLEVADSLVFTQVQLAPYGLKFL